MPVLDIITPQNDLLRKKARRVTDFKSPKLQTLIDNMVETMLFEGRGVGLAAPQVAVSQRIIVVQLPDDEEAREEFGEHAGVLYVVINPEIVKASPEMVEGVEACLSIPGYFGKVNRHVSLTIKGYDRHGKEFRLKANDWLARVFQHEIDHLDGVLFIDRTDEIWRARRDENDPPVDDPLAGTDIVLAEIEDENDADIPTEAEPGAD